MTERLRGLELLQYYTHAPIAEQGCTSVARSSAGWPHRRRPAPRRSAPSIRPDLISGGDRVMGRHFREAVIKTKLANILPNQDESDGAFECRGRLYFVRRRA